MVKFKTVLITVIFLLVIVSGLWYTRASLSVKPVQRVESSASQGVSDSGVTIEDVWAKASYFDFSEDESVSPIGFVEELAESLDLSIDDPDELLTDVIRKQLLQSLAAHSLARTDPSPETYLQLARKEDSIYRWVAPGTDEWVSGGCRGAFDYYLKGEQPSVDESPESMFRRLWEAKVIEPGNRFVQVGVPPTGARIIIGMMRTPEQPHDLIFSEKRERYWNYVKGRRFATRMRWPRRSREEALDQNGYLIIADCNMLVRTESDILINWRTLWFYDPSANAWVCDQPVIASNDYATTIF